MIDPQPLRRDSDYLRERFRRVIIMAGYTSNNGEKILAEWFDKYMADDVEQFVKMLEDYEKKYAEDPCDDEREYKKCNRHNDLGCGVCIKNGWEFRD